MKGAHSLRKAWESGKHLTWKASKGWLKPFVGWAQSHFGANQIKAQHSPILNKAFRSLKSTVINMDQR